VKMNDRTIKAAQSLMADGKTITNTNWNATQPCVYDGDEFSDNYSRGRKTADDLLKWARRKAENRSS
jgi:hypothetical protein